MKKLTIFAAMAIAAVMTGCTSIVNTSDSATLAQQPQITHPGYEAQYSLKDTRVKGQATLHVLFGLFAWGVNGFADNADLSVSGFLPSKFTNASAIKSAAVYNTCKAQQADALVGARYTITSSDYLVYKQVKCEVAGFPATMTGAKPKKLYVVSGVNPQMIWSAEKPVVVE